MRTRAPAQSSGATAIPGVIPFDGERSRDPPEPGVIAMPRTQLSFPRAADHCIPPRIRKPFGPSPTSPAALLLSSAMGLLVCAELAIHLAPLNVVPCRGKVSGGLTSREQGRVGVRVGGERSLDQTVEEQAAVA